MPLQVTVFPAGANEESDGIEFDNIDFISLVNHDTYGKPAIISDDEGRDAVRVVYINPNNISAVEVHKT